MSQPQQPRFIWITLEPADIIELKQAMLDRDVDAAVAFFQRVIVPRAWAAAAQRRIPIEEEQEYDSLPR